MTTPPPTCPVCEQAVVPNVYGYPSSTMFEDADAGLIALGGCVVYDEIPTWQCSGGHEWTDNSFRNEPNPSRVWSARE